MGRLGEAKTLGGVGSILQLIPFLNLVGYILVLIAAKNISEEVQDKKIFDNMLYAVIAGLVGVAVGLFSLFTGLFFSVFSFGITALLGILSFLVLVWVALIISSLFIRRAYDSIADRLNVPTFKTAGLLYFVGALLVIVFFVGFLVIFVALIVQIVAFFSIPDSLPTKSPPLQPASQAQAAPGMKFCPNCGTQLAASAVFCSKCGTKQPM